MNTNERETGVMYRYRPGEDPQNVGVDNFQRLSSGPISWVKNELLAQGYRVMDENPLLIDCNGNVVLYAALDERGEKGEPFFGVWVRLSARFSEVFETVDGAMNNGAKVELSRVLTSAGYKVVFESSSRPC